ncbi:3'-5' exonuclease [Alteromonas pelagimontana]|uniref:3'-5' exonuclease n=1 Tax=Alteromonas pelagimontana TaxID=1858656 RepID=A0A6M4MFA7_9ALTE|nr:3'-5' exonuclease [Alteromonas pelagimontana]QJR81558.1 3'-5' exonuclease [Alteromonas pelagimontana]
MRNPRVLWQKLLWTISPAAFLLPASWQQRAMAEVPLLALDFELTSLDVNEANITSVGWVAGKGGSIALDSAYYEVVRSDGGLAQSPVIHGLIQADISNGVPVKQVLDVLVPLLNSHIIVCHNAKLDMAVLHRLMQKQNCFAADVVILDTMKFAIYQLKKHHEVLPLQSATLPVCRERLGLPDAPAHNALDDAMATLQLWFAQLHQLSSGQNTKMKDLVHTGGLSTENLGKIPDG